MALICFDSVMEEQRSLGDQSECVNKFNVMSERVLSREIEAIDSYATCLKDFSMLVKPTKGVVQGCQTICVMCITSC